MDPLDRNAQNFGQGQIIGQSAHLAAQGSVVEDQAEGNHQQDGGRHCPGKEVGQNQVMAPVQDLQRYLNFFIKQVVPVSQNKDDVT